MTDFDQINQIAIDNDLPFAYQPKVIEQEQEEKHLAVIAKVKPIRYEFEF